MKFDLHARKVAPDVTANVVLTVLLVAKENLAVIDHQVTALPAITHQASFEFMEAHKDQFSDQLPGTDKRFVKVVKGDLPADANRDAAKDLRADLKAVRWAHRILNASWKMRCGLMLIRMESSAKKN